MSPGEGRIAGFVRAARSLLLVQLLAGLLAVLLAIWAVVEVRGLAAERDRLRARVTELEAAGGQPQVAPVIVPPPGAPSYNGAIDLNQLPPVVEPLMGNEVTNLVEPPPSIDQPDIGNDMEEPPPPPRNEGPPSRWDCRGAAARLPRCQPAPSRPVIPLNQLTPRGEPLGAPANGLQPPRP